MPDKYLLASDLGSGGCKTVILNNQGRIISSASTEYPTYYPHPSWVEQNPDDWYQALAQTTRRAISEAGISSTEIAMVGLVGVTHNTVLLDSNDRPLRNCILTFDQRSEVQCRQILARWGDEVLNQTRNGVSPLWSWPQLLWLKQNEPDTWQATRRLLFQKDYVRHRLAPAYVTDTVDAAGTLLFNPVTETWVEAFIDDVGVSPAMLPQVVGPMEVVSEISRPAARDTGLAPGTPVIAGTTDTVAEVFGSGLLQPGQGLVKLASVGRLAVIANGPVHHPNILNYRHVLDGLWYPGSGTKAAATTPRWLRDNLWRGQRPADAPTFAQMDEAAAGIQPGSEGLLFQPHLLGEWAPYWDEHLRANFIGATMRHTRAHFTRAALEGVAFSLRDAIEGLARIGLQYQEYRLIGGGAKSGLWAQIVSDVLGQELLLPRQQDAAYGAALITAVAAGLLDISPASIREVIQLEARLQPDPDHHAIYNELFEIYQAAERKLADIAHRLSAFEQNADR
ncbi:MAG: FGGY family carbohydrate kinase [Anaerolineae bacterium]|nr:FGGY family carbohydrate kinase [Anaerolineae bacterium]